MKCSDNAFQQFKCVLLFIHLSHLVQSSSGPQAELEPTLAGEGGVHTTSPDVKLAPSIKGATCEETE